MARPEVEFMPVASSSPARGSSITTDSPALDRCAEAVEMPSECPFPDRNIQQNAFSTHTPATTPFSTGPIAQ